MNRIEKEKLIKADMASIENRVRHAFNQGYDLGFKDGKSKQANYSEIPTGSTKYCDRSICLKNEYNNVGCEDCEVTKSQESTTRNCFGCKYSKDNHNAGTEECHLCMWENQYTPTTKNDLAHNLCNSCTNIGCEFQSGIVRTKCAFYMPPHIEPDNCGNYVNKEPTTKNDLGVRQFEGIVVTYPPEEVCTYPEYKGKPYYAIQYRENGVSFVGYGTYNSQVLSRYLKDYFMPTTKNDLGIDCIDRQATLDAIIKRLGIKNETYLLEAERAIYQQILAMPSVTPQPRKGHWIGNYQVDFGEWQEYDVKLSDGNVTDNCHCSECDEELLSGDRGMFCPYCGADMRISEENDV